MLKCNKCGSNNVTMLFVSYVCNICEPPLEVIKKPDSEIWHYGWVGTGNPNPSWMHLTWSEVFTSLLTANAMANAIGNRVVRVKSRTPFKSGDKVLIIEHESYLHDIGMLNPDGSWPRPDSHFLKAAYVVPCPNDVVLEVGN